MPVPLITVVGASNELPESEELDALYDRFLVRKQVSGGGAQGRARGTGSGTEPRVRIQPWLLCPKL